jgi:hypothetical protein
MKEISKDYLWTFDLEGINNDVLFDTCCEVEKYILSTFGKVSESNVYGCPTSYHHRKYNLFTFPCTELQNLYFKMNKAIAQVILPDTRYYIRCWVNLFEKGQHIDWHGHWRAKQKTYHGFYCVNTEGEVPSYTRYRIPDVEGEVVVDSKNGLLVIGKSENDEHQSSIWQNDGKPRVTIAFDVIPFVSLRPNLDFRNLLLNNYIPMITHEFV